MNTTNIKAQIEQLTKDLIRYNNAYHNNNESLISDEEYDRIYHQLVELENNHPEFKLQHSPTNIVGASVITNPNKVVKHNTPMLSLNNIFTTTLANSFNSRHLELQQFYEKNIKTLKTPEIAYVASTKYDGVAISLTYINGNLVRALTRGDGYIGEDVTANVLTIKNIPARLNSTKTLPSTLVVRGEILIKAHDFANLNQEQLAAGLKTFANARNAASGSLRQLDSNICRSRPLYFFAYALIDNNDSLGNLTFIRQLNFLQDLGFDIGHRTTFCKNLDQMIEYYDNMEGQRKELEFGIDGVVFKINQLAQQQQLGYVLRAPKYAIAYKFTADVAQSRVLAMVNQVGRTGAITPVAKIQPISLGGVIISNTTLHNFDEIQRKDIRINDYVLVKRAGEVIPQITQVILDKRPDNTVPYTPPTSCPSCATKLIKNEAEAILRCPNINSCQAQILGRLIHFASKSAMNIDSLGEKTLTQLLNHQLIKTISDLYYLKVEQLLSIKGFALKGATKLIAAISKSKQTTLAKLIYALGIRHVGEATSVALAKHFQSIDALMHSNYEELIKIDDVGAICATTIMEFIGQEPSINLIEELINVVGISYQIPLSTATNTNNPGKLANLNFVITGSLEHYGRDELKQMILAQDGNVTSTVSKNTNYLVVGANAGNKLTKAIELSIPQLSEQECLDLLS